MSALDELLASIATHCNNVALDDGDEPGARDSGYTTNYQRGQSDLAHSILRQIAEVSTRCPIS